MLIFSMGVESIVSFPGNFLLRQHLEVRMRHHHWLIAFAVFTLILPPAFFNDRIIRAQVKYTVETQGYDSPLRKIEAQARLENPADANSVRALIDAILEYPHVFGQIPPIMREIVEERLVQAEMNYKFGRSPGIPEENVAKLVNMLVDKFELPDFARSTPHQLEVLRFGEELSSPSFMGKSSIQGQQTAASPDAVELSPAQAVHILFVLIDQKMFNPDYQLSPDEWEKTQYKPTMEKLLKYKELRDSGQLGSLVKKGVVFSMLASKDLRTEISRKVSQMSLTDGLDLVNEAFEMEGLRK
jgi:hypothetical protein